MGKTPKNEKENENRQKFTEISTFYKQQNEKLNVWTFLFKNLNKSIDNILTMCELEGKDAYCDGVIDTLNNAIS